MAADEFDRILFGFLHQKPFAPFIVELASGRLIHINAPNSSTWRSSGATFARMPNKRKLMFEQIYSHEGKRMADATEYSSLFERV